MPCTVHPASSGKETGNIDERARRTGRKTALIPQYRQVNESLKDFQFFAFGELDAFKSLRWIIEADTIQMSLIATGIAREISYCDDEPLEQLLLGTRHGCGAYCAGGEVFNVRRRSSLEGGPRSRWDTRVGRAIPRAFPPENLKGGWNIWAGRNAQRTPPLPLTVFRFGIPARAAAGEAELGRPTHRLRGRHRPNGDIALGADPLPAAGARPFNTDALQQTVLWCILFVVVGPVIGPALRQQPGPWHRRYQLPCES